MSSPTNDIHICNRCGRSGSRQFIRVSDPTTGEIVWRCNSFASCQTRVWERESKTGGNQ